MKHFKKRVTQGLCLLMLFACVTGISAAERQTVSARMTGRNGLTVSYAVDSSADRGNVMAVATAYADGQISEIKMKPTTVAAGTNSDTATFTKPYDDVKLFLLDADTLTPLCPPGAVGTVVFRDHTGAEISSCKAFSVEEVPRPAIPIREHYVFTKWTPDYQQAQNKTTMTATYVAEDAANIFAISSESAAVGEMVTVTVQLQGTVAVCGLDMRLQYDPSVLEYVEHDSEFAFDIVANHIASDGSIRFNYSSRRNKTSGGTLLAVTFRVKDTKALHTDLSLRPVDVLVTDPDTGVITATEYALTEGTVTLS